MFATYFQSLIPATQFAKTSGIPRGNIVSTPRKKKGVSPPTAAERKEPSTSTAAIGDEASLSQDFPTDSSQIPGPSSQSLEAEAAGDGSPQATDKGSRPALRLPTPIPPAVQAAVARIYGVTGPPKETAKKPQYTTQELMDDPFIGVKPGFPVQGRKGAKVKDTARIPYGTCDIDVQYFSAFP